MANTTLGELAQSSIKKYLKQALAYEQPVLADTDPENLHQMRVGLRRLRTALQVFKVGVNLPKAGREPQVAAIGRQLGELRDLDVIEATLQTQFWPDLPDNEQHLLEAVLKAIGKQRQKTFKAVKKLLGSADYSQTKQALKEWTNHPNYSPLASLPASQAVPDLVLPLMCQLWLHPGWLVGTKTTRTGLKANTRLSLADTDGLIVSEGTLLHSLRKQVKRVRYQLRLVAPLYGDALEADIQRLSAMQNTLGQLQDSHVLDQFVNQHFADAKAQMPTFFALLADLRHRAWKQWQTHQQYYLNPQHRQQLQLALLQPLPRATDSTIQPDQVPAKTSARTPKAATPPQTASRPSHQRTSKSPRTQSSKAKPSEG